MYILFFEDIKCNAFIKHCKLSTTVEDLNILITHPLASFLNSVIICHQICNVETLLLLQ